MKLTLQQRLIAFISFLLFISILIFGSISCYAIRKSEQKAARERLQAVTSNLESILTTSTGNHVRRALADADSEAFQHYLRSHTQQTSIQAALARFAADTLIVQAQLYASDFQLLASSSGADSPLLTASDANVKSGVGNLFRNGSSLIYPIIVPVTQRRDTLGYLVKWRTLNSNPATMQVLINLAGENARVYIANTDGSVWYNFKTEVANPIPGLRLSHPDYNVLNTENYYSSLSPLNGTSWVLLVQLSHSSFNQTSRIAGYWLLGAALLLSLIGVLTAKLFAHKITRALVGFTGMAGKIAEGNFEMEHPTKNSDEIGNLARALHDMSQKVKVSQELLRAEAEKYHLLFQLNPMPMWIMATEDFSILDVNNAAIEHYGYTREEFLNLTVLDLRPKEDRPVFVESSRKRKDTGIIPSGVWRHCKKNGEIIKVDVIAANLVYRNKKARLILANDITEKLRTEAELVHFKVQQQKILTGISLQVQEKEREALGKELHDNINQILASVKLNLEMGTKDENYKERALQSSLRYVSKAIQEIRKLSKQLVPPSLTESLSQAVTDLLSEVQSLTRIKFRFIQTHFEEEPLEEDLKLNAYRIIQEQVSNIIKHAEATEVVLVLKTDAEYLMLTITDNGKGFLTHERQKGIGLRNIESRVRYYDGCYQITSEVGKGTSLNVQIPIQPPGLSFETENAKEDNSETSPL